MFHRRTYADKTAIKQSFSEGQYDMPSREHAVLTERLYQQILASGRRPLVIDCGANIGASVLWFTARYPRAYVLAVEPAPDNFALLQRNCAGLDVDLRNAGIDGADGFSHLNDTGWGTMSYRTIESGEGLKIEMLTVATLLASKPDDQYVPFILKVDIEGGEKTLFEGDCSAISRFPLIIMEPHDWLYPGEGTSHSFFRFHSAYSREIYLKHENIASMDFRTCFAEVEAPTLVSTAGQ